MRRMTTLIGTTLVLLMVGVPMARACGFLVAANGSVQLDRTATFVAWEDGIEHYITNFEFTGDVESFGSIIPLPAAPTEVIRAGDWTLQRLQREVTPLPEFGVLEFAAANRLADVEVLLRTRIDSLDVVVLRGGGAAVLDWVNENGFDLPPGPGTTHLLEFYGSRSPYFLAARFDAEAAAEDGFASGDGIPVQITVPTERPWVPLHILHGASPDTSVIEANIYVFTPERPDFLYGEGLRIEHSRPATDELLDELRSDTNMEWIPDAAWFSYLRLETEAENLVYDLSIGVGDVAPSFLDAGFTRFEPTAGQLASFGLEVVDPNRRWQLLAAALVVALVGGIAGGLIVTRRRLVRTAS